MTQTDLYRTITGDKATHHRTITAELAKALPTHKRLIALYAQGLSDRQAAKATGRAHGACRGMIRRIMFAAHKRIHGLPRYHRRGRDKGYRVSKQQPAPIATAAAVAATTEEQEHPISFRDFLTPEEQSRV